MKTSERIFVAGHRGMVGSAIVRALQSAGYNNLIFKTRAELDLTDSGAVDAMFARERPDYVFLAAAKVGGIHANNSRPAEFIRDNLVMETNVIHSAWTHEARGLLFLGSSCIYPRAAPQPMAEDVLLSGPLEPTNEPYALAKIAGIKLCESYNRQYGCDFRSVMPTNLYGPGDLFHLQNSHVIPALMRKFHEAKLAGAKEVEVWGTGTPRREFLHVDDLAQACLFVANLEPARYQSVTETMRSHLNVGTGIDVTIAELATLIGEVVGFSGALRFNPEYPDGAPRKLLDVSRMRSLGWQAQVELGAGLAETYRWFVETGGRARLE